MKKNSFPDWVLQHKRSGTEVRCIKGRYYLYEVSSKWDKTLKRPKKKTGAYLGSITPQGLKPKRNTTLNISQQSIQIRHFGAVDYLKNNNKDILKALQDIFPHHWETLFVCAIFRLLHRSPLKKMSFYFQNSYASEIWQQASMSHVSISTYLHFVGQHRGSIVDFFERFHKGSHFVLIDGTHLPTATQSNAMATLGYNTRKDFRPQINALFIFAQDEKLPLYYRLTGGDIREITSMKIAVNESRLKKVVIVSDKGFYSKKNAENLLSEGLHFAIPLKRNNKLIDYQIIKKADKQQYSGFFLYQKRPIWYISKRVKIQRRYCMLYTFVDEQLYQQEQKDYLTRIQNNRQGYTLEKFHEKQHRFGTLALLTNLPKATSAQKAYEYFKTRNEVEQMIDVFKNILEADRSYMRDQYHMEGWMFINHIALMLYYRTYKELVQRNMINSYAPVEILEYLDRVTKVKINDKWVTAEVPKVTRKVAEKLDFPIT